MESLANKSQALKQDFLGRKEAHDRLATMREAKNEAEYFYKIRN